MIPPDIHPGCTSPGEREIFYRLKNHPDTRDWIVLHSLDVANHVRQVVGEADFVIIVPGRGVLCLEVKAHSRIRREGGLWYFGADTKGDARGPLKQASEAMQSIRARLMKRRPDLSRVVVWSAAIFPYVDFYTTSDEWHPWQVIDGRAFRSQPINHLINRVLDEARKFLATCPTATWFHWQSGEPYGEQCSAIADALRPDFEVLENPKAAANRQAKEISRFTEEQFVALDALDANDRVAFVGPAGTGKTSLAMETARRSAEAGRKVLFLCYNRLLGQWLKEQTEALAPGVLTRTIHGHMRRIAGINAGQGEGQEFWESELPRRAIDKLLEAPGDEYLFDEVVVDEAQDMLRESYLDLLDLSLRGGLGSGRWRLFGDFERQHIYGASNVELDTFLGQRGSNAPKYALRINCRNTPRIGSQAEVLGGLNPGYKRFLRPDNSVDPVRIYYKSPNEQQERLLGVLDELYQNGFTGNDITILSMKADEDSAAAFVTSRPWVDRIQPYEAAVGKGYISYSSIHAFKGLEAPVIIVTDVNRIMGETSQDLLYIAITRALHKLVILADESVKADLRVLLAN